jgi:hypothetical protein
VQLFRHLYLHELPHVEIAVFTMLHFQWQIPLGSLPVVRQLQPVKLEAAGVQPLLYLLHLLTLASKSSIFLLVARMRFLLLVQIPSRKGLDQLVCYQT